MKKMLTYGISFVPEMINDNLILLKPSHIIEGTIEENKIINKYEGAFSQISFSQKTGDYKKMYGLAVLEKELLDYANTFNFNQEIKNYTQICVRTYLEGIKNYIFFVEKKNGETFYYAMYLGNKKIIKIDINKSAISQLTEVFTTKKENKEKLGSKVVNPDLLYQRITKRVIGQDNAAMQLAVTVCKNLKYSSYEGMKSNILLYGPTGCGKTELARTLANELDIPIVIEDVSHYTASGFVGDSVKNILRRLYINSGKNMKKAEHGIIVLDEIDKLSESVNGDTINKMDVQEELLKIIEGGDFNLNDSNKTVQEIMMNTSNITFILCGAFSKFSETTKNSIGFMKENQDSKTSACMDNDDLVEYGMLRELVGRTSIKIPVNPLKVNEFESILRNSSVSCLNIYEKAFLEKDKVKIVYNDKNEFIHSVAMKAEELGVGARGLKTVVDNTFLYALKDINKDLPNDRELIVSTDTVTDAKKYQLIKK